MQENKGVLIDDVLIGSPAAKHGVRPGERLISINGFPIRDAIDAYFHAAEESLELLLANPRGRRREIRVQKTFDQDLGLEIEEFQVKKCNNDCIFCFIHQNPRGMRDSAYFKDGDYRMSFLHGNYITTTNMTQEEIDRVIEQRFSPLYVSVHATNDDLRRRMLGVKKAPPIMERLQFFIENGIQVHTQIVLCPGWNDGKELERTVDDLARLGEGILSIAVVPLGLTDFRKNLPELKPVTPRIARSVLRQGRRLQRIVNAGRDEPVLFYSDEWYLQARARWPRYKGLDVLHQLENGVGMLADFYNGFGEFGRKLPRKIPAPRRVAALTGILGAQALEPAIARLSKIKGLEIDCIPLANSLFGRSVTVSGLLPGKDFLRGIEKNPGYELYMIPANAVRPEGEVFLDNVPVEAIGKQHGGKVAIVEGGAIEFAEAALGKTPAQEMTWREERSVLDWQ
jgi:putative radical SAM enzyme (TIGR03279 family)